MKLIELEIEDVKWDDYKRYFLMVHPNQTLDSGNPLTDDEWVTYRIYLFARGCYEKGFAQEYDELNGPVPDRQMVIQV